MCRGESSAKQLEPVGSCFHHVFINSNAYMPLMKIADIQNGSVSGWVLTSRKLYGVQEINGIRLVYTKNMRGVCLDFANFGVMD